MAFEPGGGAGQPYDKSEDLMYTPGFSIQDYISHMMQQGNVGIAQPMGVGIPDFAQDRMYGRTPPSDLDMPGQGGPQSGPYDDNTELGPDDFIRQQLDRQQMAGDVLPMRTHPPSISDVNMRLQTPGVGARSQGMQSIRNLGGPSAGSPYLDLMDVLMGRFPGPGGR